MNLLCLSDFRDVYEEKRKVAGNYRSFYFTLESRFSWFQLLVHDAVYMFLFLKIVADKISGAELVVSALDKLLRVMQNVARKVAVGIDNETGNKWMHGSVYFFSGTADAALPYEIENGKQRLSPPSALRSSVILLTPRPRLTNRTAHLRDLCDTQFIALSLSRSKKYILPAFLKKSETW